MWKGIKTRNLACRVFQAASGAAAARKMAVPGEARRIALWAFWVANLVSRGAMGFFSLS